MAKRVFYSFHYDADNWRVSQVRNMGAIEDNPPALDNDWEQIKKGGEPAIKRWIDNQLSGRSCTVVMIGAGTAKRKWIDYEIEKSWNDGKGVVGVHIHNLLDRFGMQSAKGTNPFAHFTMNRSKSVALSSLVQTYDPPFMESKKVYTYIALNLETWIDEAVQIRKNWGN
jgi:antiphage defense system Thoeris ThsB-like protein